MQRASRNIGLVALGLLLLGVGASLRVYQGNKTEPSREIVSPRSQNDAITSRSKSEIEVYQKRLSKLKTSEDKVRAFSQELRDLQKAGHDLDVASMAAREQKKDIVEKVRKLGASYQLSDSERRIVEEAKAAETEAYEAYQATLSQIAERNVKQ